MQNLFNQQPVASKPQSGKVNYTTELVAQEKTVKIPAGALYLIVPNLEQQLSEKVNSGIVSEKGNVTLTVSDNSYIPSKLVRLGANIIFLKSKLA